MREAAIDGLVKQSLALADPDRLTQPNLERDVSEDVGGPAVTRPDIAASLKRLSAAGEVEGLGHGLNARTYQLTPSARAQLLEASRDSQRRFDRVTNRLFRNAPGGPSRYRRPLVDCLAILFSRVAHIYIRLLKAEVDRHEFATGKAVSETLNDIFEKYREVDGRVFARGVYTFLTEVDPEFDEIKFNMTQNYYISRMLGLDDAGTLLSREMFGEAIMYLDTNVFHDALEPRARLYQQFQTLSVACKKLGIELRVCQISVDEHRALVSFHRSLVDKVEGQIPEETRAKIDSLFFQAYMDAKRKNPATTTADVFEKFAATSQQLSKQHAVELVDDAWFDAHQDSAAVSKLAKQLQMQLTELTGRIKRDRAARHDALLLTWIERERIVEMAPVWLVTLDSSLCTVIPAQESEDSRPLAITLDALLQWIAPVSATEGLNRSMRDIFAQAVKYQLLPQDRFLDLDDFLLFAEMEWSCKDLPSEDVEECVRYMRHEAAGLDMTKAADRERVTRQLAKFFLDPTRKYQQNLQDLERALESREAKLAELQKDADARFEALRREHARELLAKEEAANERVEALRDETATQLSERDARIAQLAQDAARERAQRKAERLRASAHRRLALVGLIFAALVTASIWLIQAFPGVPDEPVVALACVATLLLGWAIIGRERFKVLSWPVRKLFRIEDSDDQAPTAPL